MCLRPGLPCLALVPPSPTFTTNDRNPSCLFCAQPAQGPEPSCHAECYLLEQIQSWNLDPKLHYGVTCFLSWSPCAKCAQKMARFLQENSHVSLKLFASRLYTREQYDENYKEGLRTLKRAGASIAIMTYRGQRGPPGGGQRAGRGLGRAAAGGSGGQESCPWW